MLDPYRVLDQQGQRWPPGSIYRTLGVVREGSDACSPMHTHRPQPPKRVVVIGAGGFVGSAIVKQLTAARHSGCWPRRARKPICCRPTGGEQLEAQLSAGRCRGVRLRGGTGQERRAR